MLKKLWHWMTGQQDQPESSPEVKTTAIPVSASGSWTYTASANTAAPTEDAKPKRTYTKKKVDNAEVFVADDVEANLSAKGVDVDKAVASTLKKTSPKPKKKKTTKIVKK